MTQVFSEPALLEQANLTTTSLYDLAKGLGKTDINSFMQYFIQQEHHAA
jgi:energy-coupling factor transport system ATP-binding protein